MGKTQPLVAAMVVQPGQPDQILALEGNPTLDAIHRAIKARTRGSPFRLGALDVGEWEVGTDNPRSDEHLPVADCAIHRDAGRPIGLSPRRLWKGASPGRPDRLLLCAEHVTETDVRDILATRSESDLALTTLSQGVFPIRRWIHSYRADGRWLDELGYFQFTVPGLSGEEQRGAGGENPERIRGISPAGRTP